jgi:large conductance mechanosensitive channel
MNEKMNKGMDKGKGFIDEFKKFIMRGNVMDMAVGVIVGGAFTSIVTSLNADILTPILGIFGGTDFSNLKLKLGTGDKAPVLCYGNFITAVINFLITAFVIFLLIKALNAVSDRLVKKTEEKPTTKDCPYCLSKIAIKATRCPHCTSQLEEKTEK